MKTISPNITKEKIYEGVPPVNVKSVSPVRCKQLPISKPVSDIIHNIQHKSTDIEQAVSKSTPKNHFSDSNMSKGNGQTLSAKHVTRPKKIVIEKNLDTTTTFQKAAAFWKKS